MGMPREQFLITMASIIGAVIVLELEELRARVDFAERLLAQRGQ
jgi:hypothetical protein